MGVFKSLCAIFITSSTLSLLVVNGNEDDATELDAISQDFLEWEAETVPEFSTKIGYVRYNDRLENLQWQMFEQKKDDVQEFKNRLIGVDRSKLQYAAKINYDILKDAFETFIDGYQWRYYGALNPVNFMEGIHTDPAGLFVELMPFKTWGDFVNYLSRLDKMPNQLNQVIDRLKKAIQMRRTNNNASMNAVPEEIDNFITANPQYSVFFKPFSDTLGNLTSVPQSDKNDLRQWAMTSIQTLNSAFEHLKTFIVEEYMPQSRTSYGVQDWELDGKKYYAACLKWHLSLDMTPEQVHQIGLDEVDRISKEMRKILTKLGKQGTPKEFFNELQEDPRFHRNSAEELLNMFQDIINKAIEKIPQLFHNYPNIPIRVQAMASDGSGGEYRHPSEDGSRPGTFVANVMRPKEVPVIQMPALTLHEAVPGHHLQVSYGLVAGLPEFRSKLDTSKSYAVPFRFPGYTAFTEGWALYAESLGEEMGLYKDDYELMGRYGSEMIRACRLVIDTGLHHYGWSRERAIEYLLNYTAYTRHSATKQIDRYITWPGQACAYKMGELKIKELRQKAKAQLGDLFDIKDFHRVVLDNGRIPLVILEDLVNTWIDTRKRNANQHEGNPNCASDARIMSIKILICVIFGKLTHIFVSSM